MVSNGELVNASSFGSGADGLLPWFEACRQQGGANCGSYALVSNFTDLSNFADFFEFNERSNRQNSDTSLALVSIAGLVLLHGNRLIGVNAIMPLLLMTDNLRTKHEPRSTATFCFVHDCRLFVALFDDTVQFATIDTSTFKSSPPRFARCPTTWSGQSVWWTAWFSAGSNAVEWRASANFAVARNRPRFFAAA